MIAHVSHLKNIRKGESGAALSTTYEWLSPALPCSPISFCRNSVTAPLFIVIEPLKVEPLSTLIEGVEMSPVWTAGPFSVTCSFAVTSP